MFAYVLTAAILDGFVAFVNLCSLGSGRDKTPGTTAVSVFLSLGFLAWAVLLLTGVLK